MQINCTNKSQEQFTFWSPHCLALSVVNHTVVLCSFDLICIKFLMQLFIMHGLVCMLVSLIMPMHLPLITVNNECLLVCCSKYCKWARVWLLKRHQRAKSPACLCHPAACEQQKPFIYIYCALCVCVFSFSTDVSSVTINLLVELCVS